MRPTLRCVLVFAGGLPVALAPALVAPPLWTLWLGYVAAVAVLIGFDALLSLPRRRLDVAVNVPDTLYIGETDDMTIRFAGRKWTRGTVIDAVVDLDEDLESQDATRVAMVGGSANLHVPLVPRRRGTLRVERVWLRWRGPFGLLERRVVHDIGRTVAVVPNVRAVRSAALRYFSAREFLAGLKQEVYVGDGSEFESLREYTPGLDHRAINWKASARHRRLLCQEFRAERNHQVVLALDSGQLMSEPMGGVPKIDHALNAGLLLAYFGLRSGDRVGMYAFDEKVRSYVEPVGGLGAFEQIRRRSADIDYYHHETNFTLGLAELSIRLRRRSLIILLTDFVDTTTAELMVENLHRLARKHLVVFVTLRDPDLAAMASASPHSLSSLHESVVANDLVRERDVVIQRLRNYGVQCIDVAPSQVSFALLNRYLDIKRREMI